MSQSQKRNVLSPSQFMPSQDNGKERTPKQRSTGSGVTRTNAPPFGASNMQVLDAINGLKDEFNSRISALESTIADKVTENLTATVQTAVVQEVQRVCEPISHQVNHHQKLLEVVLKSQQRMEINECKLNAIVTKIPSDATDEKLTELMESVESVSMPVSIIHRKSKQGRKHSVLKFSDVMSRNAYVKSFRESNVKIGEHSLRIAYEIPPFQKRMNDLLFEKMRSLKTEHPNHVYRVDVKTKTITCDGQPILMQNSTGDIFPLSKDMEI